MIRSLRVRVVEMVYCLFHIHWIDQFVHDMSCPSGITFIPSHLDVLFPHFTTMNV